MLLAWLALLRAFTGSAVPRLNRDALGANFLVDSLIHELVDGGRLPLVVLAVLALLPRARPTAAMLATGAGVLALPLAFFAPLPRYMLPGLPWLCALAALAIVRFAPRTRAIVVGALVATQVIGWFGPSWHANGGHHLDCNLRYRTLLETQREAVRAVAAEHPRAVAAAFPLWFAFSDPPVEGWLPSPLPVVLADGARAPRARADPVAQLRRARAQRQGVADRLRCWRAHSYAASAAAVDKLSERSAGSCMGMRKSRSPAPSRIRCGSPTLSRPSTSTVSAENVASQYSLVAAVEKYHGSPSPGSAAASASQLGQTRFLTRGQ
jgi:hypothetical protein